jgi:type II secretory pathway predicted ATPase ExeA
MGIQTMTGQLVQVLLYGQSPEIATVLEANRALHSRIAGGLEIKPFAPEEVQEMISHRLRVATTTRKPPIFDDAALARIAEASRGIPRLVCRIAEYACIQAAQDHALSVTEPYVMQATKELRKKGVS